ncbi:MAG: DUF3644 domain-containing protein [Rickettsiales bacterium]|nr:DUF3644 domain-containing protein [Rickettsiales bacterium]
MKSRHNALLDKSLQAALSAIELYNKPNFSYREESFSILMINAWELLLKAKRLKDNNGNLKSLYRIESDNKKDGTPRKRLKYKTNRTGNFETFGIVELLKKEIGDQNLKIQIETLIQIRDNAVHFMNSTKLFEKDFLEIATASLKSYEIMAVEWFNKSLSEFNLSLIPLTFSSPDTFDIENLKNSPDGHKKLLDYLRIQKAKNTEECKHDIALVIDVKFTRSGKGMSVKFDKDGAPIIIDSEESFRNKYPLPYDDLKSALPSRYEDFKFNKTFWDLKKILEKDDKLSGERYLDHTKKTGMKKRYYSSNIYKELDKHYTKNTGAVA